MTDAVMIGPVPAPDLQVMTYNIRRPMGRLSIRPADRWSGRSAALRALLRSESPSLLGVQEAMSHQAEFVLRSLGPGFRYLGYGRRADRRGEGCPLFYDERRLELLDWEQSALSDRPTEPGSTTWGNVVPRVVVSAAFRDRATSAEFLALNTHFDHISRRARLLSARAVRLRVADAGLPAVVTGDLNAGETSTAVRELFSGGGLEDAWRSARTRVTAKWGTFPNYGEPAYGRKRIDWIAVTPDVEVSRIGINPRRIAGVWASDHLPVQAVVRVPAATAP